MHVYFVVNLVCFRFPAHQLLVRGILQCKMVQTCCIVGCSASKAKNPGLTFHAVKRARNPQWQARLIQVVNSADSSFNADSASICSRHFTSECFTPENAGKFLSPPVQIARWAPMRHFPSVFLSVCLSLDRNSD